MDRTYCIYLVEDDKTLSEELKKLLENWGFEVFLCRDFRKVTEEFSQRKPHLVLLDIGLPAFNGYHWCSEIRKTSKVPIIFLSSAADGMNIVMAMNMGGDDFVAKPFDTDVLLAKIRAILRRSYDYVPEEKELSVRGARLDMAEQALIFEGKKIELTRNEYRILLLLMESCPAVVSREKLMEALWQSGEFIDDNTLTVNVTRLRKKLEAEGLSDLIRTRVGTGYQITG